MSKIEIIHDLDRFKKDLDKVTKDKWPKILSKATTETAFYIRNKLRSELPQYIDKPTPYTTNSIFVRKGNKDNPEASVEWRKPAGSTSGGKYLVPQVEGGNRSAKKFERALEWKGAKSAGDKAVPTKEAPKDIYGNVPGSYIKRMLSLLRIGGAELRARREKAALSAAKPKIARAKRGKSFAATMRDQQQGSAKPKAQTSSYAKPEEFFALPKKQGKLSAGVYEVKNSAFGRAIRLVFLFTGSVTYKKSFPFYDIGNKASNDKFPQKLSEAVDEALKL